MADQVEEIKAKTDIVSVIRSHVGLKKAGRNFKAPCPFHSEKTPSFVVSPELQIFKCFGCGESGDAFSFLQKYEGMDFYEALKFLADKAGIKLKPFGGSQRNYKERLYQINSLISHFYNYVLQKHPAGVSALAYLTKERGLKPDTIRTFHLGYSPDEPLAFKKFLVDKKKIDIKDLERVGVVLTRRGKAFDRFRGRVIFPLYNHRGNIAGFAGRTLPSDKNRNLAKYVNTPETDIYHKSSLLYGLSLTKKSIKREGVVVVVEGELDMISSWQAGIKNIVAIKGSAFTQEQIKLLSRYTKKMVLAFDADVAGGVAARRGIEIAEKEGFDVGVASLSGHKDPDEMARSDPGGLKRAIKNANNVWDFIIDSIFSQFKEGGGRGKANISREIVPVLSSINDRIVQAHYVGVVAKKLNVPIEAVANQVTKTKASKDDQVSKLEISTASRRRSRREILEERLITVVFRHDPSLLSKRKIHSLIHTPLVKRILKEYAKFTKDKKKFDSLKFIDKLPKELVKGFSDMFLKDLKGLEQVGQNQLEKEIKILVREIEVINIKKELEETARKIRELEKGKQWRGLKREEKKFGRLTKTLVDLEESDFKGIIL